MPDSSNIPSTSGGDRRVADVFFDLSLRTNVRERRQLQDLNIPNGFRFRPDDQQLITYYLANKVLKRSLVVNIVKTFDIYACDPDKLPISKFTIIIVIWLISMNALMHA